MPELPEVRTVAKVLKKNLLNKEITNIKIIYPKMIEKKSLSFDKLIGKSLTDINTKGKFLIFTFEDLYLVSHLRMEGKYFIKKLNDPVEKHEHIIFEIGDLSVRYHDTRKFGRMILVKDLRYLVFFVCGFLFVGFWFFCGVFCGVVVLCGGCCGGCDFLLVYGDKFN